MRHVPRRHPRRQLPRETAALGQPQGTENEALRAKLGLDKETGVVVCEPFGATPDYPLRDGT